MRIRIVWVAVVATLFALATPFAYADGGGDDDGGTVASLNGESFISQEIGQGSDVSESVVTGECNPLGTSTFDFTITGLSAGLSYPGTFTESGTLMINLFDPTLNSYEATFTIDSPAGDVTGSKSLAGFEASSVGTCTPIVLISDLVDFEGTVSYSATINATTGGSRTDSGTAFVSLFDSQVRDVPLVNGHSFSENFTSNDPGGGGDDDDDDDD
jgi:hypothetical protein